MINKIKTILINIIRDPKLFLISCGVLATIILIIFGRLNTKPKIAVIDDPNVYKTTSATAVNIWQGVVPGVSKFNDTKDKFGKEVYMRTMSNDLKVHYFDTGDTTLRGREVGVDRQDIVVYIYDPIAYKKAQPFSVLEQALNLGSADIKKYDSNRVKEKYYVYLNKGIALSNELTSNTVIAIMYFKPMSQTQFLNFWGSNMSDSPNSFVDGPIFPEDTGDTTN